MECELCGQRARMFCESDEASLCWTCDEKVHAANFLVANHHRNLLCNVCQSPTPWNASGPKLTPTVSVCERCLNSHGRISERGRDQESQAGNEVEGDSSYEGSDSEGYDEENEEEDGEEEEEEAEDGDNQVVPWSHASSSPPPSPPPSPPAASSSSEGICSAGDAREALKRRREIGDRFYSDDEMRCSSTQQGSRRRVTNDEATSPISFQSPKHFRPDIEPDQHATNKDHKDNPRSRSTDMINSVKRLQNDTDTGCDAASRVIVGIGRLDRDQSH